MKCRKTLLAAILCAVMGCAALTACSAAPQEDVSAEQVIAETAGTYQWSYISDGVDGYTPEELLTELQDPSREDYIRGSDVEKVRALMESDCVILNEDGTGSLSLRYFTGDGPLTCSWSRSGDAITLDYLVWGLDPQLTLTANGENLVLEFPDTEYTLTFTKQANN